MKEADICRLSCQLRDYDARIRQNIANRRLIGVDEAGRGPLAGPVFAAAVELDEEALLDCVNDSKLLGERARKAAFAVITSEAAAFGIATASVEEIDRLNIRQASLLAMRRAVLMVGQENIHIVVDGKDVLGHNLNSQAVIKGDRTSLSIAAASILAKVARDEYMLMLDEQHPGYGFAENKGYPTKQHLEALRRIGPAPCHRITFRGVL